MAKFPVSPSSNKRYLVDANGIPFRVGTDASWDTVHNLGLTDIDTYFQDRVNKGFKSVLIYYSSVPYFVGGNAPYAASLGGSGAGTAALPFTKNISGGAWNGDPTFSNHDASFANPNDAFFEWLGSVIDAAESYNLLCFFFFCYWGFNAGANDGWWQTIINSGNTSTVCTNFGTYLANGHGTFQGFKNRSNIVWVCGGDYLAPNGGTGALRSLDILTAMQSAGDTHPVTAHWQHDYTTPTQTDFASSITVNHSYTHGNYPTNGPTYPEALASYALSPTAPVQALETAYWSEHGNSLHDMRLYAWGWALSCGTGSGIGFGPFWGFCVSPDGSSPTSISAVTCWQPSFGYLTNQYVSANGNWYKCVAGGTSGTTRPSGTGSPSDGSLTWQFQVAVSAGVGGMQNLFNDRSFEDFKVVNNVLDSLQWWKAIPSAQASTGTIISSGQGTAGTWSNGTFSAGGYDFITSAAASDASFLVAYVPDAHSGTFAVDLTRVTAPRFSYWVDPVSGAYQKATPSGSTYTVPGPNSGGDDDWVLLVNNGPIPSLDLSTWA